MKKLVVGYAETKQLLPMRECIDVMADALSALARGEAEMPLRTIFRPQDVHGVMAMMPSFRRGNAPLFGLKAICVFPDNAAIGKDAHQGGVLLFSGGRSMGWYCPGTAELLLAYPRVINRPKSPAGASTFPGAGSAT